MGGAKWTPGPWMVGEEKKISEIWNIEILGQQGYSLVSTCYGTTTGLADWYAGASDVKANAHLIAAAPDLYEVLELAVKAMEQCSGRNECARILSEHIHSSRLALAKARGELK